MIDLKKLAYDKTDQIAKGISDYIENKKEQLMGLFTSENFTIDSLTLNPKLEQIDDTTQLTFLNDIYIERSISINKSRSATTVDHTLDNNSIISETKVKSPFEISLSCKFTGIDHKEKMKKIEEFYEDTTRLNTLSYDGEVYNNLAITSLNQSVSNVLYSEFEISLKEYRFIEIKKIPSPEAKKIVDDEKNKKAGKLDTSKELPEKSDYEKGMENFKKWNEEYGTITNPVSQMAQVEMNVPLNMTKILMERKAGV